jgi:hypothetical protein
MISVALRIRSRRIRKGDNVTHYIVVSDKDVNSITKGSNENGAVTGLKNE